MTRTTLTPADLRRLLDIPFSDEQLEAATAPLAPGVIVAGAGSGKTTVMAARVVWLVATGAVRPDEILGLTFTNKAAAELLGRVRRALADAGLDPADGDPEVSTYHAFAARLLSEHGLRIGVEPGATLVADAGRHQRAYRTVCRTTLPLDDLGSSTSALVADVLALDDALAERGVEPGEVIAHDDAVIAEIDALPAPQRIAQQMRDTARRRRAVAALVSEFRAAKAEQDVLDFADQVRLAQRLAESRPEVGAALRERHRVVLLDEYQDTSVAQRRLLQALFGDGHPVTAVGDPCQAIYGWRGASVHNIDMFPQHFPRGDDPADRFGLPRNRRSGPRILAVANDIATPLRAEHAGVHPLEAGATDRGPGLMRCALLDTYAEEVEWVADRVAEAGAAGSWNDVAVLVRVAADAVALQRALAERDVPTQVVGAAALLAMPEVVDVHSVLEVLHDPAANAALLRLLTGPRWAIGPRDLAALGRRAAELVGDRGRDDGAASLGLDEALDRAVVGVDAAEVVSLADALEDLGDPDSLAISDEARARFAALADELRALRRHVGEPLVDLVHRVLATTGLDVELAAAPEAVAAQRRANVAAFADLAADFRDLDGQVGLGAFLAWLRDAERFDAGPQAPPAVDRDAVVLMTVHKAKGLEYPVVALPFLADGVFPSARGRGRWTTDAAVVPPALCDEPMTPGVAAFPGPDGPRARDHEAFVEECRRLDLLEEIRLAYVAVTRAERALIASGHRWGPTQSRPREPSAFLEAVRAACIDGAGPVDVWAEPPEDGATNPALLADATVAWPVAPDPAAWQRRAAVAAAVREAAVREAAVREAAVRDSVVRAAAIGQAASADASGAGPSGDAVDPTMAPDDAARVRAWDTDLTLLLDDLRRERAAARRRRVRLPDSLSASQLLALADDPQRFARDLVRPMPRPPAPAARRGTRFHAWIESRLGQQPLLEPDDLPGAADDGIDSDEALERLRRAFADTAYADLVPDQVEASFALVLAGRVVRGRIDAVFRHGDRWEVVDWKTGAATSVDPLQLAIYRVAWAERVGVPVDRVDATFVLVGTGEVVRPEGLPDRADLEALLTGSGQTG